jgi:hypothetical protein
MRVGREMVTWEDPDRGGSFYVLSWFVEINRKSVQGEDGWTKRGVYLDTLLMNNGSRVGRVRGI